jgi:hypothetical protein
MSDRTVLLLEVMAGFVVILALMFVGWQTRRRRQRDIPAPAAVPTDLGQLRGEFDGFYISTTPEGQPLNRIAVRGLGFRARATIAVTDAGVILGLPGNNVFIRADDLREVTSAQYTIDRVVEPGGMVLVAWTLGATNLDSYLRVVETQNLIDAIASLIPADSVRNSEAARKKA